MTYRDLQRLEDITAAIAAIRSHVERGSVADGLTFDLTPAAAAYQKLKLLDSQISTACTVKSLDVYAPIQEASFQDGSGGISRHGRHGLGGSDCNSSGPFGSYRWSVTDHTLRLTPVNERCPNSEAIWAGVWTLESPQPPTG